MLVVVSGPSTVGKSFCVEFLCRAFGFTTLTPYTSRKPRVSESEGYHYHFRSRAELREISANLSTGYWDRPFIDEHIYGYSDHVNLLPDDPGNWIIQAASAIALGIKARCSSAILVFLDFGDDETMQERIRARYVADGEEAIQRRLRHATRERSAKNRYDHTIASNSPEQITRELLEKIRARPSTVSQKTTSLPGPLADIDIRVSLEAPNGLRIDGVPLDVLAMRIHGWSVDLSVRPKRS